jgi:hypothetical protein
VVAVAEANTRAVLPDFNRQYRYFQFQAFAQDTPHCRPSLDYGIDRAPARRNTGPARCVVENGTLRTLRRATVALYAADRNDFAARVGFAIA